MDFEFLKNIDQLKSLYETLSNSNNDDAYLRCLKYGKNIESLVRYTFSIEFPKYKADRSEMIKLIRDREFRNFLGRSEYSNKIHFIYLAGCNAAFDHDIDNETADLAYEQLKEITCVIFNKLSDKEDFAPQVLMKCEYKPSFKNNITEAKTRELYIDVNLKNAKYHLNKYKDEKGHGRPSAGEVCVEIEVHDLPNQKVGYADYVIYNKSGLPITVIEAKRTSKSSEVGAQQAKDYADALVKEYKLKYRPIIYYTNGYEIKIQDRLGYPARSVYNFASMEDLELLIKRQLPGTIDARKPITDTTVDRNIINRSKLVEAVQTLIESMNVNGEFKRKGLLVLPCGVGKTRTAVALSKILLKNDWAQNILFLADRNNLVSNAIKPFKKYIDGVVSDISAENSDRDTNARICICTYQSMISYINKPNKEFSVGHFDLIIVDEAHRSLFNFYRSIFEYFDSFVIGLTATPSKALDRSTYDILDLEVDKPTFEVKFEEAVNLGYLVSYKAFDKKTKILKDGVKYDELTPEEKKIIDDKFVEGQDLPPSLFKKTIVNSGSINNEKTIDEMFEDLFMYGLKVEQGTKIGKTLIFAVDHAHAEFIVDRFKGKYGKLGDEFCQVIDTKISKNKTRQDNFAIKDRNPQIVVSVDMMDTGVDIPEIVNLVFFKPVYSKIKFDQMWGRGTRTCENLHVISPSKDYFEGRAKDDTRIEYKDKQGFFIFDYCSNFEFFDKHPNGIYPAVSLNISQKIYSTLLEISKKLEDSKYQVQPDYKNYHETLKTKLSKKIAELDINRADVHAQQYYMDKYKDPSAFTHLSDGNIYEIKEHLLLLIDGELIDDSSSKSWSYKLTIVQLSLLDSNVNSKPQQVQMIKIAKALLKKASISEIFKKIDLLSEIADEDYYESLDFFKLEKLKGDLGDLMKYLKDEPVEEILTSFNDVITTKALDSKYDFDNFKSYKDKFISYLNKYYGKLESVNKILHLETLNSDDLNELKTILKKLKKDGVDEDFYDSDADLVIFIRRIIGLDRKIIDEKCASFINNGKFNKEQRQLINLIINFAIKNGNISNEDLVNTEPFSEIEIGDLFDNNVDVINDLVGIFNKPLPSYNLRSY